ncbi:MAG: magnesium transporter [Defluviitaleaceae bacterium]|nr:magnesium transporter [Defluviitaleaceae bacterium]
MRESILQLAETKPLQVAKLRKELSKMNMVDIGEVFEWLNKEQTIQVFRLLPKDIAANVFAYIEKDKQQIIVEALTDNEVGKIIEGLFANDAADFIEEMPANVVNRVLSHVNEEKRAIINQLLQYPDDSVGSIMTTEYMELWEDYNIVEAFDHIRKMKMKGLHTCYVIRRDKLLVGSISLRRLLLAKEHERVGDMMRPSAISVQTLDDQEKAARLFRKYDLLSLPVVDKEGRLVGIIEVDDAVDIVEEETTEDFEKMAAILPSEDPYLRTGVFRHSFSRVGWLLILMLTAILTEMIITDMEEALAILPALAAFMPMLMDMGGNVGSQTSTLIIRSMALDEIKFSNILTVWWREIRVALLCAFALSLVNAVRVLIFNPDQVLLTITVTLTLVAVITLSKSLGALLPMFAKKLHLDPAVLATPIIKTLADVVALLIYFGIAAILIPELR